MSDHIARQEITRALKEYEEAVSSQTNQIASSMVLSVISIWVISSISSYVQM